MLEIVFYNLGPAQIFTLTIAHPQVITGEHVVWLVLWYGGLEVDDFNSHIRSTLNTVTFWPNYNIWGREGD